MSEIGINQFIYTDISRDGTLSGPNYKKILELINPKYSILAAGGITNIEHLKKSILKRAYRLQSTLGIPILISARPVRYRAVVRVDRERNGDVARGDIFVQNQLH